VRITRLERSVWELEPEGDMRVPGRLYASEDMLEQIQHDPALRQLSNVAHLPGVFLRCMAMPDIHYGYGFPIGGVAATTMDEGVISPGGVGYDINCGVRMIRTCLKAQDIQGILPRLMDFLFFSVPSGIGSKGDIRLDRNQLLKVLEEGIDWAVKEGYAWDEDPIFTEDMGRMEGADTATVSERALDRGREQLGTLGSGNHFLEIQRVDNVFDAKTAECLGIELDQIVLMIHSGSRGFGYQVCDDALKSMRSRKEVLKLPDKQLCCAPHGSNEGKRYWSSMACAANYGWVNRQILTYRVRKAFEEFFKEPSHALGLYLVYDVAHNIAKRETHIVQGQSYTLCVHRKGATRAFGPGRQELPDAYRPLGQPVLIPGSMGSASYLLLGTMLAMEETFGSTAHGAGRRLSRKAAMDACRGRSIPKEMQSLGVFVRAQGKQTLAEEIPEAYKDVDGIVDVLEQCGLSRRIARMMPLGCVKG